MLSFCYELSFSTLVVYVIPLTNPPLSPRTTRGACGFAYVSFAHIVRIVRKSTSLLQLLSSAFRVYHMGQKCAMRWVRGIFVFYLIALYNVGEPVCSACAVITKHARD